jgi:polar amino acid transport system substrate-binding protein
MGAQILVPPIAVATPLQDIQTRGYLIVGVKDSVPPLGFQASDGTLQGLEIDIAHRLAQELLGDASAVELRPLSNRDRLPAITEGEVDIVIARLTATNARSRIVDFSVPYYLDGTAFLVQDSQFQQVSDLSQQAIAVLNGSTTIADVRYRLPTASLVGVESYEQAEALLNRGEVTAVAADASVLTGSSQSDPNRRLLPGLISAEALSVAIPRGLQHDELKRNINEAIARWHQEGWLQERISYWGLPQ